MKMVKLGWTEIEVSRVCLGSMTWGRQNTQADANEQIEFALSRGVNFIDTAEMYAIPPTPDTYGSTETIIGNWLAENKERRKEIILATKIAGNGLSWIREGGDITGDAIIKAVDDSLGRLQTDYIDLYQLHWPNRTSPHFGKHWPGQFRFSDINPEKHTQQMLEILQAIDVCVKAGKIRHFGLSDDTTWGINQYLKLAEHHNLPRVASIQNEFNLLHTKDWPYLIENCIHEQVAYLPWSPLAGGALSGKYRNGERPEGSRWSIVQRNGLFRDSEFSRQAIQLYCDIADQYHVTPSQLALAWCAQIDGVTSTIIGATDLSQLQEDINAFEIELNNEALTLISDVLKRFPSPF